MLKTMPLLQKFHDFLNFCQDVLVESIFKSLLCDLTNLTTFQRLVRHGAPSVTGPFNVSAAETRRQIRAMAGELGTQRYSESRVSMSLDE